MMRDIKVIEAICELIEMAIENGEYSVSVAGAVSKKVKGIFETKGYKVNIGSQYNETFTDIIWSKGGDDKK